MNRGNILRLFVVGVGTVIGMAVLAAPFVMPLAAGLDMPLAQLVLTGAGMVIVACALPSFALWYLSSWMIGKTRIAPHLVPVAASAVTAVAGALFITFGITGFAGVFALGIFAVLAIASAAIAVLLTYLLFPFVPEISHP